MIMKIYIDDLVCGNFDEGRVSLESTGIDIPPEQFQINNNETIIYLRCVFIVIISEKWGMFKEMHQTEKIQSVKGEHW